MLQRQIPASQSMALLPTLNVAKNTESIIKKSLEMNASILQLKTNIDLK